MYTKFSVTKNGIPLDPSLYNWDEKSKIFSTTESNLVLNFTGIYCVTFKTGSDCTFITGWGCTFTTGSDCTFNTGWNCTFITGLGCTFTTGSCCTFNTGSRCTFTTGCLCVFNTGNWCVFTTARDCTFNTGWYCTFNTGMCCTFKTGCYCTFKTGCYCTFKTGWNCTFNTEGKSALSYTWNWCYELYKLDRDDVEYTINEDGTLTIKESETEEQRKIRELKETIDKAKQQINEIQKMERK